MTGHRVATKLSQELAQVDRGIRIARLKAKVDALSGGTMVDCSGEADENSAVVESFWEQVLLFESASLGTNFAQLEEAGMQLLRPPCKPHWRAFAARLFEHQHDDTWAAFLDAGKAGTSAVRTG